MTRINSSSAYICIYLFPVTNSRWTSYWYCLCLCLCRLSFWSTCFAHTSPRHSSFNTLVNASHHILFPLQPFKGYSLLLCHLLFFSFSLTFYSCFLLFFLFSESSKLSFSFLLFFDFFLTILLREVSTLLGSNMLRPVFLLYEISTILTLISLHSASLDMRIVLLVFEDLVAPRALLRFHLAGFFMITESVCRCSERTVLTFNRFVSRCFVFLSLSLGNNFTALFTFVVISGAAYFVHAELAQLNRPLAVGTNFCFFLLLGFYHKN